MKIGLWEGQNSGCVLYWRFWDRSMKYEAWHGSFFTVSDNRWSCGRAIFQGNPASKTNKTSSPFHNNIVFGNIGPLTDVKSIRYEDICRWHRIFGSIYDGVYIRDGMSSIGDSWTDEVTKNIFLNNNTFHLIIMMISVVLCKINEEINYVSIFHNHVVRIWLHNRPAKLSWNRNKNSKLQMLCLEYIVWWYGQFVTNWYHFIEMSFHST